MERPKTMAKSTMGTFALMGTFSFTPSSERSQSHLKAATNTPFAAAIPNKLRGAVLSARSTLR